MASMGWEVVSVPFYFWRSLGSTKGSDGYLETKDVRRGMGILNYY